ncbi:hypothetical protein [Bradyrhizobium campsiandrae]|jgi:NAD(P)-dependent dehydrogenase (short-subunit alcohol dehydrogenase family)|nr:hypothetical protein [Bradyrhizobium campsiandrae]
MSTDGIILVTGGSRGIGAATATRVRRHHDFEFCASCPKVIGGGH